MRLNHRFTAAALTAVFGAGILSAPAIAGASEEGRKNTAIGLGAAAAYLLLTQKDKVPGLIAGAGAAYAYKKYDDAKKDRQDRERYGYYGGDRFDSRYDSRYDRNRDLYHDRGNDRVYRTDRNYNDRYYNDRYYNDRNYNDRYNSGSRYNGGYNNRYDSGYNSRYDYRGDRDCEDNRIYSTRRR